MKKSGFVVVCIVLLLATLAGYHLLSPKVEVLNNTNLAFDELIVQLPRNRVSLGPVLAGEQYRVYYSLQQQGEVTYSLLSDGQVIVKGALLYQQPNEIGRAMRFDIQNSSGVISVNASAQ